ncbi:MAG: DUF3052 domain-containing protein [Terriglobales bacterium]|jgi:hypothetical protein
MPRSNRNSLAGYSGTPLPKKLGIKEQFHVLLLDPPPDVSAELKAALATCRTNDSRDQLDFAMIFVKSTATLKKEFSPVAKRLTPAGMLWVSWPKKTSGVATDLTENDVRSIGLQAGLVDVKVCAVNEIWSGLKFVIRVKDRPSRVVKPAK